MPREEYRESLEGLRTDVEAMGDLALEQLDDGLHALRTNDDDLARSVVEGDGTVNETYLDMESDCIDLFALQQPVASDLRFVAASFKIITDLERVGDLAANIGSYSLADERDYLHDVEIEAIGEAARDLLADALAAYLAEDAEACYEIAARDDDIDGQCVQSSEQIVRDLVEREAEEDPWRLERLIEDVSRALLSIRDLERVGDHGVNVAARTLYMVEGDPALIY